MTSLKASFDKLQANQQALSETNARDRIQVLKRLLKAIYNYQDEIEAALAKDLGKPIVETRLVEILPVTSEIRLIIGNLRRWMATRRVQTPLTIFGHASYIVSQPKGVVLILSPWNFPVNLSFMPMISAIAAGNAIMLKPSEFVPNITGVMRSIVESVFEPNHVILVEGGVETASALLDLPFNHIFFTGSPAIGKIVMAKAALHLASVTLELGGKSPVLVDRNADIRHSASRTVTGRFANCGQICVAPDYVLIHQNDEQQFIEEVIRAVQMQYGNNPTQSVDYACIINQHHYDRLNNYLIQAEASGAKVYPIGKSDPTSLKLAPAIISGLPPDSPLLHEEIFGPILPVVSYQHEKEALEFINTRPAPLSLYLFGAKSGKLWEWVKKTRAGGTCFNTVAVHFYNSSLPFGGVNNSGIGRSKGYAGYLAFSNERGVVKEILPYTALDLVRSPYTRLIHWISNIFIRWL